MNVVLKLVCEVVVHCCLLVERNNTATSVGYRLEFLVTDTVDHSHLAGPLLYALHTKYI